MDKSKEKLSLERNNNSAVATGSETAAPSNLTPSLSRRILQFSSRRASFSFGASREVAVGREGNKENGGDVGVGHASAASAAASTVMPVVASIREDYAARAITRLFLHIRFVKKRSQSGKSISC